MNKTKAFYITLTTLLSVVCIAGIVLLSMPKVQASLIKNSNEYNEILDINSIQNDHISNLNGLIDDLNNQIDSLKSNLSNLENEKNNFENLYNQGLISIEEKDNAILDLNEDIMSLNLEILTLEEQVDNLSLQFQSLYETKIELEARVENLNNQIAVLENNYSSQSDYINSLLLERQGYLDEITLLEAETTDYLNQIAGLQQEIKELKSSVYQDAKFTTLNWVYAFNCVDNLGVQSTYYVGDYAEETTTTMHIEQIKFLLANYQTITYGSLCGLEVKIPLNNTLATTKIFAVSNDKPTIDAGYKDGFSIVNHNVRLWNGSGYDFVNIDELSGFYNVRFSAQKYGTGDGNYILDLSFNLDLI